jgi:hypothetical protein
MPPESICNSHWLYKNGKYKLVVHRNTRWCAPQWHIINFHYNVQHYCHEREKPTYGQIECVSPKHKYCQFYYFILIWLLLLFSYRANTQE